MVGETTKSKNKNISTIFNLCVNKFKDKCKKIKLEIRAKLKKWKKLIISVFNDSETLKYCCGSFVYVMFTGVLVNAFTSFYFNLDFTLKGIVGSGGIMFLLRYEVIEFIRDIRRKERV